MINSVYIEITNVCNLHCSFCPCGTATDNENTADNSSTFASRTFMDSKLFEDCIAGAQEIGATNVYFHVLGEPTLHPGFVHYLKKLEQTPLKLTLTTNGTTIERTGRQILASSAVRQVNFSTHAYAELPAKPLNDICKMFLIFAVSQLSSALTSTSICVYGTSVQMKPPRGTATCLSASTKHSVSKSRQGIFAADTRVSTSQGDFICTKTQDSNGLQRNPKTATIVIQSKISRAHAAR